MSRISRNCINSSLVHNISRGFERSSIFATDTDKREYLNLIRNNKLKYDIKVLSYCIMSNHVHMLVMLDNIENMIKFMHNINATYGINYNNRNKREGYVFQGRYKSVPIRNCGQLISCIKYIHMNPVKANIVKNEEDYEFSSCKWYKTKSNVIDYNVLIEIFGSMENCINALNSSYIEKSEEEKGTMVDEIKEFAKNNKIRLDDIGKNKVLVNKLYKYLLEKEVRIYKNELAKKLKMPRSKLYRMLK